MRVPPYFAAIGVVAGVATAAIGWNAHGDQAAVETTAPPVTATAEPAAVAGAPLSLEGRVLERIDVQRYSYLRLSTSTAGEVWAAVPRTQTAVGDAVKVADAMLMTSFTSQQLGRTFDAIYFGAVATDGATSPHGAADGAHAADGSQRVAPPAAQPVSVPPAAGPRGHTVAQVIERAGELAGRAVLVRAVVVKQVAGVLGRNWLHVQDGSKTADGRPSDLVVTTTATVGVGQQVLVDGAVQTDKDLGSGYRYAVLIEDAAVTEAP